MTGKSRKGRTRPQASGHDLLKQALKNPGVKRLMEVYGDFDRAAAVFEPFTAEDQLSVLSFSSSSSSD